MGGCYSGSYSYSDYSEPKREPAKPAWQTTMQKSLKKFFKDNDVADLVTANNSFFEENKAGFIDVLLKDRGVSEAPKEFPEIEYEVKFSMTALPPKNGAKEPSIQQYLAAFDFPATTHARFLKDPIDSIAEGRNHFFGSDGDEKLVVIEKGGKTFLKEKSQPIELKTNVQYGQIVMKRTEERHPATMEEILAKVSEVNKTAGVYQGNIRKEKGDAFILDTNDGRIYSFTMTRAHLGGDETKVQRQLEMEYAGYIPGFEGFSKSNEEQIVKGMVDLAKFVAVLYQNSPVANGWKMHLELTNQRKYDFVREKGKESSEEDSLSSSEKNPLLLSEIIEDEKTANRVKRIK